MTIEGLRFAFVELIIVVAVLIVVFGWTHIKLSGRIARLTREVDRLRGQVNELAEKQSPAERNYGRRYSDPAIRAAFKQEATERGWL